MLSKLRRLTAAGHAADDADIELWDGALEPGYGKLGDPARQAMELLSREEGILLDPVYTAKVFAALPALAQAGHLRPKSRVLFVHTGGLAALFGYQTALESSFPGASTA